MARAATPAMIRAAAEALARETGIPLRNYALDRQDAYLRLARTVLEAALAVERSDA